MTRENFKLFWYFIATTLIIYGFPRLGAPPLVNQVLFVLLIAFVYVSRDELFWLCWYFVVIDAPGRLFTGGLAQDVFRLPIYNIAPGLSVVFQDLFLLMFLLKALTWRKQIKFVFKGHMLLFIAIGGLYFGISFAIGISLQSIINTLRMYLPWFWVLIVPHYLVTHEDLKRVYTMLVPIVILAFITQIQTMVTGAYLHDIFSGTMPTRLLEASEEHLVRVYSAHFISFLCVVLSLHYMSMKKPMLNSNLLVFTAFLGSLTIFLSGTRGWIIVLLILYASFFFVAGFGFFKQLLRVLVIVGLSIVILSNLFPLVFSQGSLAVDRLLTLETLVQGDLTAGGTLSRLTERGPRVMAMFRESPVIGWAFSDTFHNYADFHVGNQTNLLNLGILGFLVITLIYISIFLQTLILGLRHGIRQATGNSNRVYMFALLGLFVAHSSSTILWGYFITQYSIHIYWAFMFAAINVGLTLDTRGEVQALPATDARMIRA